MGNLLFVEEKREEKRGGYELNFMNYELIRKMRSDFVLLLGESDFINSFCMYCLQNSNLKLPIGYMTCNHEFGPLFDRFAKLHHTGASTLSFVGIGMNDMEYSGINLQKEQDMYFYV